MSKFITDDQMRSLWRARCQARNELRMLGAHSRPIHDFSHDDRKAMRRYEYAIHWTTKDLERGLRQRPGHRFQVHDALLLLGDDGGLIPVWEWMWTHGDPSWQGHATKVIEASERRETVAC